VRYLKSKIPDSQTITLTDFSAGALNLPPERTPPNGFYELSNCEYDPNDNSLVTSPGLTLMQTTLQSANIDSFFYSNVLNSYFFSAGGNVYETNLISVPTLLGALSGANPAKYHHFDNKLFITSGGVPQYYNGATFTTLSLPTPATITSITYSYTTATVTTATAHNLLAGAQITVSGASPSNYNGSFLIASVPSTTTFTYVMDTATPGVLQVNTATVVGTVTATGNISVVVTAAGLTGSPKTYPVSVVDGYTASQVAAAIVATLAADTVLSALYTATNPSGSTTTVVLTAVKDASNDSTLNIAISNGTAAGITNEPTSVNTTAGVGNASPVGNYTVVDNLPNVDSIIDKDGRIECTKAGDDNQYYSAIGAYATVAAWTNNPNDPSSAFTQPVGYKDSASTVATAALSTDIMVFKTPKRAYRIFGDPTLSNYAIYEASRDMDVANANCVCVVDNNVFLFGSNGFDAIQTTQAYGSVQKAIPSVGGTWNTFFRQNTDSTCRIWYVESRSQIWIKYNGTGNIALFHYRFGGVFTFRKFENPVVDITENNETVYIAIGKSVYQLNENSAQTENQNIVANLVMGKTGSIHDYILSWYKFSIYNLVAGDGNVIIGINVNGSNMTIPFSATAQSPNAFTNTENAFTNTDPLVYPENNIAITNFCNYRVSSIQPQIQITSGRWSLRQITLIAGGG
jgi:hypothetical protein